MVGKKKVMNQQTTDNPEIKIKTFKFKTLNNDIKNTYLVL